MDTIHETLIKACQDATPDNPARTFGALSITSPCGTGYQASVFKAVNRIGKQFAIKFYQPTLAEKEKVDRFKSEVQTLVQLNHKNIVTITSGGRARFQGGKWSIEEGLDATDDPKPGYIYFYVMQFVRLSLRDIFPRSYELDREGEFAVAPDFFEKRRETFSKALTDVCHAVGFVHAKGITHRDIKSPNVLFKEDDGTFVLSDFGYARSLAYSPEVARRWSNTNTELTGKKMLVENDIWAVCEMFRNIWPEVSEDFPKTSRRAIESVLNKVHSAHWDNFPFPQIEKLTEELDSALKGGLQINLGIGSDICPNSKTGFTLTSKIRIPVTRSVFTSDAIESIIDTAEFQRLRGVRQLGPTAWTYPGASHTRFEHSLGTYQLSLRYIQSLSRYPGISQLLSPADEWFKATILAALLHDLGHYPYSHWIEEIKTLHDGTRIERHEDRGAAIISGSDIATIIRNNVGVNPQWVCELIQGQNTEGAKQICHSVLDSVLDLDKLDYLIRDSSHCGVDYGHGIDVDRALESLFIDSPHSRICLTEKGRSYVMSLLACRNLMYQEVYWHKTVRACTSMFKAFFFNLHALGQIKREDFDEFFLLPDDVFVWRLRERAMISKDHPNLTQLINPFCYSKRALYKVARSYWQGENTSTDSFSFWKDTLGAKFADLNNRSEALQIALRRRFPAIGEYQILVENTPAKDGPETYNLRHLRIWSEREMQYTDTPDKLNDLNEYLGANRRAFIFCHPDVQPSLATLSSKDWDSVFRDFKKDLEDLIERNKRGEQQTENGGAPTG